MAGKRGRCFFAETRHTVCSINIVKKRIVGMGVTIFQKKWGQQYWSCTIGKQRYVNDIGE